MADPRWGFSDVWWPNLASNLAWMRGLGCDALRFGVSTKPEEVAWALDEILPRIEGFQPFVGAHTWGGGPEGPPSVDAFADYWRKVAERYQGRCHYWLWNEPNLDHSDAPSPDGALSVEKCTALCDAGARAIHDVAPDARVLGPIIAPVGPNYQEYQRLVYAPLPTYVHVGINLYPLKDDGDERLDEVREDYDAAAKLKRTIHVTEIDMAYPHHHPEDTSAPQLARKAYDILARKGARTILFNSIENHREEAQTIARAAR